MLIVVRAPPQSRTASPKLSGQSSSPALSAERPSAFALAAALTAMNADPEWIACAKLYVFEHCLNQQKTTSVRIVALP